MTRQASAQNWPAADWHTSARFSIATAESATMSWGRLDGAERVLALLGIGQPSKWRATAFDAIPDEEQAARAVASKNLKFMRDCVARPGSC